MLINQDKLYKSSNLLWSLSKSATATYSRSIDENDVSGPFCINCRADLWLPNAMYENEIDENSRRKIVLVCPDCKKKHDVHNSLAVLKHFVVREFVVKQRSNIQVESLDDIPAKVKARDEDDKYFLASRIGEKDGKRVGVVYFGEKSKEQNKEDYSQVFVDLDEDQVRFDKSNKAPKDILAKLQVEFKNSIHEEKYKKR